MTGIHIFLQSLDKFDAIHLGHHQVGDDQVRKKVDGFGKGILTVGDTHYIVVPH